MVTEKSGRISRMKMNEKDKSIFYIIYKENGERKEYLLD